MSDNPLATLSSDQEIPCMLLPLIGSHLLVPTTTVAEMSAMQPLEKVDNAPDWLLGNYAWRGMKIPVISVEAINGEIKHQVSPQGRIAVLNNTGVKKELPFIAIHTQGIPRMARVSDSDIVENDSIHKRPFDLMAVKVGMEEFYLPDITAIEMAYINVMQSAN